MKNKISWILLIIIFGFAFCMMVIQKAEYLKIDKEELKYTEVYFQKYEKGKSSKNTKRYYIYTTDDVIYGYFGIVDVDQEAIDNLVEGNKLEIYYRDSSDRYIKFEIIELYANGDSIVTIEDYHNSYKNNIIRISIGVPCILVIVGVIVFFANKHSQKSFKNFKSEPFDFNSAEAIAQYELVNSRLNLLTDINYLSIESLFEEDIEIEVICKYLYDTLDEREMKIIYDSDSDNEVIYIAYKLDSRTLFDIGFVQKTGIILLDEEMFAWEYPSFAELSENDVFIFKEDFQKLANDNGLSFEYSNDKKKINNNL